MICKVKILKVSLDILFPQPRNRRAPATFVSAGQFKTQDAWIALEQRVCGRAQSAGSLTVDNAYALNSLLRTQPDVVRN